MAILINRIEMRSSITRQLSYRRGKSSNNTFRVYRSGSSGCVVSKQSGIPLAKTLPINGKPISTEVAAYFGYGEPNWTDSRVWNVFQCFLYVVLGIGIGAMLVQMIAHL